DEDRVDQTIVDVDDVRRELDLPEALERPTPSDERRGMRLRLRCTACRYEREHDVGKVYYDLGTHDRRQRGEETPYHEVIITRRITCPKCGAVDRYELTNWAHLSITAEMLKQ